MKIVNQKEIPSVPPERPVTAPEPHPVVIPETPNAPPEITPSPEIPATPASPPEKPRMQIV